MLKNKMLMVMLCIFLISVANATVESLPSQRLYTDVTLKQMGADFVGCNITSISYPNTTTFISNTAMIKNGNEYTYIINSPNITTTGSYVVNGYCTDLTTDVVWVYDFEVTPSGFTNMLGFYILVLILSLGIIVLGFAIQDAPVTILGSFGLYFLGIYILFNGLVGVRDLVTTWAIGIIVLGVAFYISARSTYELIVD